MFDCKRLQHCVKTPRKHQQLLVKASSELHMFSTLTFKHSLRQQHHNKTTPLVSGLYVHFTIKAKWLIHTHYSGVLCFNFLRLLTANQFLLRRMLIKPTKANYVSITHKLAAQKQTLLKSKVPQFLFPSNARLIDLLHFIIRSCEWALRTFTFTMGTGSLLIAVGVHLLCDVL